MRYRELGKTGLMVSEIGFGAEWITGWEQQRVNDLVQACERAGVNIVDCWMADPSVRAALGVALAPHRADYPGAHWFYLAKWPVRAHARD